jgi:prevent-host-death family protein
MKKFNVSEDIIPVAAFKTGISKYLKAVNETGHHLIITQNGRPAGVLISPSQYDDLIYRNLFTESVNRGLKDVESGEVYTTEEMKKEIESIRSLRNRK